ncbi:rotatin-like [Vanessa tameamea]|uniref:Rotatin-like n=1 Tax=Vanessa tameamea TaxID=334116 RepID=A0A8B8ICP7_VANTA
MSSVELSSTYIRKLNHPLKEIRERTLQLLVTKLRLGWELEDELGGTRELLEALLAWFHVQEPSLQREALELLLTVVKTKAGSYIAKEFSVDKILLTLNKIKPKLVPNAIDVFDDIVETLNFMNTVDSQVNVNIPYLKLTPETSSASNGSSSSYYNIGLNKMSSNGTPDLNEDIDTYKTEKYHPDGVNILLLPWVDLSPSDFKTIVLIGDSLKVLKSTRRCCRFIRDVFLRDFPVEIFLNRPVIIKTLLAICDGQSGGHPGEALHTLLCITQSLHTRFSTLFSLDLVSQPFKVSDDKESNDDINAELEQFAGNFSQPVDDALITLRQLPVPIYALDAAQTVLTIMTRSVVLVDSDNDYNGVIDMNDFNTCLCLVESLIELLLRCVTETFWVQDHSSKIHRDIAHKACMVMRMLGELVTKFKASCNRDPERSHHRGAWLRTVSCGERLLNWTRNSALAPTSIIVALQAALIDPALELLYPTLAKKLAAVIFNSKSLVDQEYKSKYRELNKLFVSMDYAVQFMKQKESSRISKNILTCIKNSIPILYLNVGDNYLKDIAEILLRKSKDLDLCDSDWSIARSIALNLMAHSLEWVQVSFYKMLSEMVKSVLMGEDEYQSENEKCLTLICDVGILTEICCHGLSSEKVGSSASDIVLYVLRGRLVLSAGCWWRLLASLLPVLPLLHVYAAHDTQLGKAICKSLEPDIVECMGISKAEMIAGLIRLLFVNCAPVQLDAAYALCRQLDDERFLPPRDSLRSDVILNALRRLEVQDFNIDQSSSPSKNPQTAGLLQIIEVLKQDLVLNEETLEYTAQGHSRPALEPSLRRSTLQQLAVMMRQQELHETFLQSDGLNLVVSLLRLSLMVDDYLAFPECAISCVSILNSICFVSRHNLVKISDLPLLLIRVILVFPANDSSVLTCAQLLALQAWAGFALQELDASRRRVPALPLNVIQRTSLPFTANSYWGTSPNTEHSSVEWLLTEDAWRSAIQVRWWWSRRGSASLLRGASPLGPEAPLPREVRLLRSASVSHSCAGLLLALENATSHAQVTDALNMMQSYTYLVPASPTCATELEELPWHHTRRFLSAPPASSRDTALLISLLKFIVAYMDNMPKEDVSLSWIKTSFIGSDAVIISLLSRDRLYPHQTLQEDIELIQLRIHIVKVLLRCVLLVEQQGDFSCCRMESFLKILLSCLERIDLKNFHTLGYLNELIRCIRYATHSRYCDLSEETVIQSLKIMTHALSGCASGAGRKGRASRRDALLALLALLRRAARARVPPQRWSESWEGAALRAALSAAGASGAGGAGGAGLRGAALHVLAALAHHAPLHTQILQHIEKESLCQYAIEMFSRPGEANLVRAAAAALLTTLTSRTSSHTQTLEHDILRSMEEGYFLEDCMNILVEFLNDKDYKNYLEPNVPLSVLERGSELEVRAQKSNEINLSPLLPFQKPPPTADLVVTVADVIHNITIYKTAPVKAWNEQGLYRVLFRYVELMRIVSHLLCVCSMYAVCVGWMRMDEEGLNTKLVYTTKFERSARDRTTGLVL